MQDIAETVKVADPKQHGRMVENHCHSMYKFAYSTFEEEKVFFRFKEMSEIIHTFFILFLSSVGCSRVRQLLHTFMHVREDQAPVKLRTG